nr:syntaxin-10 [Pogona vitticeps]
MSLEDPFFVVKGEVQKAVNTAHGLYNRWCQLLEESHIISKEEFDWTTNELRNSLRSIDWDLEDLEETICIVESNPHKFRIELSEVATRRSFITEMRESVKEMRDHIASPAAQALINRKNREALMGDRDHFELLGVEKLSTPNSHTLEQQQLHQKLIIEEQDEQLELVSGSIRVLKHMSGRVGEELDEQSVMLEDFAHEMDDTHSRMEGVLKKMTKVSHVGSGRRQWCIIGLLLIIVVVALILLFAH